jgi:hypothetical protein
VREIKVEMRGKPMKKIIVLFTVATFIVASVRLAAAQQPKKVPRVGYLSALEPDGESTRSEAFGWLWAS